MEEPSTTDFGRIDDVYGVIIMNIEVVLMEEYDDEELIMVEDPIQETQVVIEITINRYTQSALAASETLEYTTTDLYFLEGFLGGNDENNDTRLDELNRLVRNKIVSVGVLEEIKKNIFSYSSQIKELALKLKRTEICVEMEVDLLTRYVGEVTVDDDEDEGLLDYEEYTDYEDDNNDVGKPALRSSVEALEKMKFEKKEELELMMKNSSCYSRSCMVCLDEFSIDGAEGAIVITTMPCSHVFHNGCIDKWLEKRYTCPICRYEMPTAATDV